MARPHDQYPPFPAAEISRPAHARSAPSPRAIATHGASVHFVTAQLDGGPVIAQAQIPVLGGDAPDTLAARLLPLEHRLLAASVDAIARGRIALRGNRIECDGKPLAAPLHLQADGSLPAVG
jgi:phosphoribosylglycinamide formyltransferase-1